jgi:alkanesulfonate monooxygenase SsuD/methylene tetrahydromethanopterin reductase-like flavin-dependent oxidoreductase (luciferase family)
MYGLSDWFNGNLAPAVELAAIADRAGVDMISITDHVVMGEATDKYPYGRFPSPPDYPWFEPLTFLATVAGATRDIRLGTAVVIAPLRPAVLLAKQAATLDVLSRGRLDLGVGVGWQKEEYEATGIPFDQRYGMLEEQLRAVPKYVFGSDHSPDLEATLAQLPALLDAGVTVIELHPRAFCSGPDEFEAFVERLITLKHSTRNRS